MKFFFSSVLLIFLGASGLFAEESSVNGRIGGQDKTGAFLGAVEGATVEFLTSSGTRIGQAVSGEGGYYEITGLPAGIFTCRILADGYEKEDEQRGYEISEGQSNPLDFILTKPTGRRDQSGILDGSVVWNDGETTTPLKNVMISARRASGKGMMQTFSGEDGKYQLNLAAGDWRVSAFVSGFDPQVHRPNVTLGGELSATVDFKFSREVMKAPPLAKEVYALVAVNLKDSGAEPGVTPQISFVDADSGKHFDSTVKKQEGIGGSEREWFQAEPAAPLATGSYRVEATREGFPLAQTDAKTVYQDLETFYDVEIRRKSPEEEFSDEPPEPLIPGINGRVSGQTLEGDFIGSVSGAKIELRDESGNVGGTAVSGEGGYYEINDLKAGKWYYRISASDYAEEDGTRGFELFPNTATQPVNFVLSKDVPETSFGKIIGTVTKTINGKTDPLADTTITVKRENGVGLHVLKTDSAGKYAMELPAAQWKVSALGGVFGLQVHPEVVTLEPEAEVPVDFSFGKTVIGGESTKDVFALVAVQIGDTDNPRGRTPSVFFVSESDGKQHPVNIRPSSAGEEASGYFDWYHAEAKNPLPVGNYHVTGALEGYEDAKSETKAVTATESTWYDLNLLPIHIDEPDPIPPAPPSTRLTLNGRVYGQTLEGDFEGEVDRGTVSLFNQSGARVHTVRTGAGGYYEINGIDPGEYTYSVKGPPYLPLERERGLFIPASSTSHSFDFVLSRPVNEEPNPRPDDPIPPIPPQPPLLPGIIFGQVQLKLGDEEIPLPGIPLYAMREGGQGFTATQTDQEGNYSFSLPQGSWRVAAVEEELDDRQVVGPVILAAGKRHKEDFLFQEPVMPEVSTDILILTSVERVPTVTGDMPDFRLLGKVDGFETRITNFDVKSLGINPNSSEVFKGLGMDIGFSKDIRHWYAAIPKQPVTPGQYQASAMLPGYLKGESLVRFATEGSLTILDVDLDRVRPEIDVLVVCSDDQPIEDANLFFINNSLEQSFSNAQNGKTDTLGQFMAELASGLGEYTVMAKASAEFEPRAVKVSINDNRVSAKITLFRKTEDKTIDFTGIVVEFDGDDDALMMGNPAMETPIDSNLMVAGSRRDRLEEGVGKRVSGATVTVTSKDGGVENDQLGFPLKTDAMGEIKIPKLPLGSYDVAIKAKGYEDWEGSFDVASIDDTEPEIFSIIGRNTELENWIRMILIQGWGNRTSQQYHVNGVNVDPEDGNIDYAYGLSLMKSGSLQGASTVLESSVNKMSGDNFWVRACDAYVWSLMCQKKGLDAAREIQRIVTIEFGKRSATATSRETAYVFGLSVGIMKGPWSVGNTNAIRISTEVDQKVVSSLKGELLSEYKRGRDQVLGRFQDLSSAQRDETTRIAQAAAAKKAQLEATVGQEMSVLEKQIQDGLKQMKILDANWARYEQNAQTEINGYNQQRGMLTNQARSLNAQVKAAHCAECAFPHQNGGGGGADFGMDTPGGMRQQGRQCPHCTYAQELVFQKNQILMGRLQQQEQILINNINLVTNRYNQEKANYLAARRILEQNDRKYRTDYQRLSGRMTNLPDPTNEINQKNRKFNEEKVSCETYRQFPVEARRRELLGWVDRDGGG